VDFVLGDIQALEFEDASFDHVLLFNLMTYASDPRRALAEASRVLRPRGDLVVTTLAAHEQSKVTAAYGHVHDGFKPQTLREWLNAAGVKVERCEVTSREKRPPHFAVLTAFARKGEAACVSSTEGTKKPS